MPDSSAPSFSLNDRLQGSNSPSFITAANGPANGPANVPGLSVMLPRQSVALSGSRGADFLSQTDLRTTDVAHLTNEQLDQRRDLPSRGATNIDDVPAAEEKGGKEMLLALLDGGDQNTDYVSSGGANSGRSRVKKEKGKAKDGEAKGEPEAELHAPKISGAKAEVSVVTDMSKFGRGAENAPKVVSTVEKVVAAARTLWEGSRLLRVGATIAAVGAAAIGAVALGTVVGIAVGAVVVGVGAAAIVGAVTHSPTKALTSGLRWGADALVPASAVDAFKQGDILKGLDETLGISAFKDMVVGTVKLGWDVASSVIRDPNAAVNNVVETAQVAGAVAGVVVTAVADRNTRNAALGVASDGLTGENTGKANELVAAVSSNNTLKSQVSGLVGSPFGAPQLATGPSPKGSRVAADNDAFAFQAMRPSAGRRAPADVYANDV